MHLLKHLRNTLSWKQRLIWLLAAPSERLHHPNTLKSERGGGVFICSHQNNSDAERPPALWRESKPGGASGFYAQVGVQRRTESGQQSTAAPRVHDLRQAKALNQDVEQCRRMHVCVYVSARAGMPLK